LTVRADVLVIGGGIVGLATAYRIAQQFPAKRVVVLEKEPGVGQHQSGRNSGVMHSGIYYEPGSLRAAYCREGKEALARFCDEQGIAYDICGKMIVAVDEAEVPRLQGILERGQKNGVRCEMIGPERLAELEPHAAGVRAIHVPDAGIVNFRAVCERLAEIVNAGGGEVVTRCKVTGLVPQSDGVVVQTSTGEYTAGMVVNCAGLYSDRIARMSGQEIAARIVPFRGEFYELQPAARCLCNNLIYPVPDPSFPFLGVHFTRLIQGGVECGPNAVLAFAREGYRKADVNWRDLGEALTYSGFRRLAARNWRTGLAEQWRSLNKAAFVRQLQRLVPEVRAEHLTPSRTGVRAQALAPDGQLVHDFLIQESRHVLNVCNAPSPAATSSLRIGSLIAEKVAGQLGVSS
jgi:L-2-hydroxyglutarate oxidase